MALFRQVTKAICAYLRNQNAVHWCRAVGWLPGGSRNGVRSFAVKQYGLEGAKHLAEEMCRKGDFFVHAWIKAGSPSPFDFQPIKRAYVSTAEYMQCFDSVPLNTPAARAALEIAEFVPSPVP